MSTETEDTNVEIVKEKQIKRKSEEVISQMNDKKQKSEKKINERHKNEGVKENLKNKKMSEDELRHVFSSKDELSENVGKFILEKSLDAIEKNGRFTIAFSGGSLPALVAKGLLADDVEKKIDWKLWHFFWSDERCVPLDDKDSNYRSLKELLLDRVDGIEQSNVHHIDPKLVSDPTKAAAAYEAMLKKEFGEEIPSIDLLLLGMGPDGHTCSLFPGHKLLEEKTLLVAPITDSPKPPSNRITLTYPIVNASKLTAFVCTGSSKQEALSAIWGGGNELPSGRVTSAGGVHWFVDEAAVASDPNEEKKE